MFIFIPLDCPNNGRMRSRPLRWHPHHQQARCHMIIRKKLSSSKLFEIIMTLIFGHNQACRYCLPLHLQFTCGQPRKYQRMFNSFMFSWDSISLMRSSTETLTTISTSMRSFRWCVTHKSWKGQCLHLRAALRCFGSQQADTSRPDESWPLQDFYHWFVVSTDIHDILVFSC